jgi:hypothetical protein
MYEEPAYRRNMWLDPQVMAQIEKYIPVKKNINNSQSRRYLSPQPPIS